MCAVHSYACRSADAHRIATAIDAATDSNELRAVMVVYAFHESSFRVHPKADPHVWDSSIGLARGPWQEHWATSDTPLETQARSWLWCVQRAGLAALDSSPSRAYRRAAEAERLLSAAGSRIGPPQSGHPH